ncbi:HD-GYP domain-containing protein [Virgibacillus pantothenticus]|uniref:HD-GYP domain-containing protein n=1 Tax=Virgibacillus pantothenticus TaxID=1473 RepID=UPI0025B1C639|nr:HD-GYP domain-containing protein [Virgibacillus pantothenticus]
MWVKSNELSPGCVLLRDVKGKSQRPLIPKNTVITEEHITVLHKFLIETVDVSPKKASGEAWRNDNKKTEQSAQPATSFERHYHYIVHQYKKMFVKWQNGAGVDITEVRALFLPILEKMEEVNKFVFKLHQYAKKEDYLYHHHIGMAILAAYVAYKSGYPKGEWLQIGLGALLSDCGMARISPEIIHNKSTLSEAEMEEIKKHPTYSYRLTKNLPILKSEIKQAIIQHHERLDGSGYPLGLTEGKINRYARIIAVCDTYHAMTSERWYQQKQSPFQVIEVLQKEQFSKLDPETIQSFIQIMTHFSIGTRVRLSNQKLAEIVFTDHHKPTRPMVRLDENKQIIALDNHPQLFIEELL